MKSHRHYIYIALVILVALVAAGCDTPTATPEPTEVPPTDEPADEPAVEPTNEPADEPADAPTDEPADEPVEGNQVVLIEESVLTGEPEVSSILTVNMDAETYTFEGQGSEPAESEVPEDRVDILSSIADKIEAVDFFAWEEDYIPEDGSCCDMVYYTIQVTQEGETHSVRGTENESPEGFMELVQEIERLIEP